MKLLDSPDWPDCVPKDKDVLILETETGIRFIRTSKERFKSLPGYPFEPHYALIDGLRMHYVDEGPAGGEVVLILHGQPTWSYLYRKMITPLVAAGYRTIAADPYWNGKVRQTHRTVISHLRAAYSTTQKVHCNTKP